MIFQFLILFFTSLGYAFLIRDVLSREKKETSVEVSIISFFCSISVQLLVLQNLYYLGFNVTTVGKIVALIGLILFCIYIFKQRILKNKTRLYLGLLVISTITLLFHAIPAHKNGVDAYYGFANHDQENYVLISEYILNLPYKTTIADVALNPWILKGLESSHSRIGQSIFVAYASAVSGLSCKESYAGTSIFLLTLIPLGTYLLARSLRLSSANSLLIAFISGVLPSVTKMQLDGFLSQVSVQGFMPAVVSTSIIFKNQQRVLVPIAAIMLSFILSCYTELFIVALGITSLIIICNYECRIQNKLYLVLSLAFLIILLNIEYSKNALQMLGVQYSVASTNILDVLRPFSKSFRGWGNLIWNNFSVDTSSSFIKYTTFGFIFILTILFGVASRSKIKRKLLLSIIILPSALCVFLLLKRPTPLYALGKIMESFTTFWLVYSNIGTLRFGHLFYKYQERLTVCFIRRSLISRTLKISFFIVFLCLAITSSWKLLQSVNNSDPHLRFVNSLEASNTYNILEEQQNLNVLVLDPHPIKNLWDIYHARKCNVYTPLKYIGDIDLHETNYQFQKIPELSSIDIVTTADHIYRDPSKNYSVIPLIKNKRGVEADSEGTFYWLSKDVEIDLYNFATNNSKAELQLRVDFGPSFQYKRCKLSLIASSNHSIYENVLINGDTAIFPLNLSAGVNSYRIACNPISPLYNEDPGLDKELTIRIKNLKINK